MMSIFLLIMVLALNSIGCSCIFCNDSDDSPPKDPTNFTFTWQTFRLGSPGEYSVARDVEILSNNSIIAVGYFDNIVNRNDIAFISDSIAYKT